MSPLNNLREFKQYRQALRRDSTKAEAILWLYLRQRSFHGYKFRRQHGIGPYIVDFYCPRLKLAIELDGSQHFQPDALVYDRRRDAAIQSNGIKVIRFINSDIFNHLDSVLDALGVVVKKRGRLLGHPIDGESE